MLEERMVKPTRQLPGGSPIEVLGDAVSLAMVPRSFRHGRIPR